MNTTVRAKMIALAILLTACGAHNDGKQDEKEYKHGTKNAKKSLIHLNISNAQSVHWHPGHYLDIGKMDSNIMKRIAKLSQKGFENFQGVQVTFNWGELQRDSGTFEFTSLDLVHQKLKQMGKQLVLRIEDRSFKQACAGAGLVPSFVGTVTTTNASDQMCVAKIWEQSTMTHFINLIKAIYDRYKTESTFEAIMTQETALPKSDALDRAGYTRMGHFTQLKRMVEESQGYAKTIHIMQMINFLSGGKGTDFPGDLAHVVMNSGAAISNPDTHPTTNSKKVKHDIPVYDAYKSLKGHVIAAPNFNTSDLDDKLTVDLMKGIYLRAVNDFGAHYVFWDSHGSSKFHGTYKGNFVEDIVLPVVNDKSLPPLKANCPAVVEAKRGPC